MAPTFGWRRRAAAVVFLGLGSVVPGQSQAQPPAAQPPPLEAFFAAASADERQARAGIDALEARWRDRYTPMIIDLVRLMRPAPRQVASDELFRGPDDDPGDPRDAGAGSGANGASQMLAPVQRQAFVRQRLLRFLERQTGQRFGEDLKRWREWMWKLPADSHPAYAAYKGEVYAQIDPRMRQFFRNDPETRIRLDEVDWGGVTVNGIPPLVYPKVLPAGEASYLRDGHLVFGVVVNGEARAYPKRILAWHEMAIDRLGGVEMTIVYCTLCGTVIPYESAAGGRLHRFGTSGLLYRSNKLMFDETTLSLWNTIDGRPVIGELATQNIQLTAHAAVTTTWGEWRAEHPDTTVLSLETGHTRDYREGAAYRDYFSHDDLYFAVSHVDRRLKNKAEVVTLRVASDDEVTPVAIAVDVLKPRRVYPFSVGERRFVVLTSAKGANRVYAVDAEVTFTGMGDGVAIDAAGGRWRMTEEALVQEGGAARAPRVAAQRAFWFGWVAQYPQTLLFH